MLLWILSFGIFAAFAFAILGFDGGDFVEDTVNRFEAFARGVFQLGKKSVRAVLFGGILLLTLLREYFYIIIDILN